MRLKGRVSLITGATSGIGAETARAFAKEGSGVILSGRDEKRGQAIVDSLRDSGYTADFIGCELGDRRAADCLIDEALSLKSNINILVNSAGVVYHHTVVDTSDDVWHRTFDVNVHTIFYLSRKIIPHMIANHGGVIINVASTWGLVGAEQTAAYCASKGAVVQLSRAMALDYAKENIRVNALCPGAVDTPMLEREAEAFDILPDEGRELWAKDSANNRLATAQDIARSAVYLASDDAAHVHGVALAVDGGATAM